MVKFVCRVFYATKLSRYLEFFMLAIMLCLSNYELTVNSKKLFADFYS